MNHQPSSHECFIPRTFRTFYIAFKSSGSSVFSCSCWSWKEGLCLFVSVGAPALQQLSWDLTLSSPESEHKQPHSLWPRVLVSAPFIWTGLPTSARRFSDPRQIAVNYWATSLGQPGGQTSQFQRKSTLNIYWKG